MHTPDYLAGRLVVGQRLTLEPLRRTLERLNHPERDVPVVLIGGTNGKGSTQAFLASILAAAGHRVGVFTSPSLEDFHELVSIDGRRITPEEARPLLEDALEAAGTEGLTLFEAATALAFLAFSRHRLDVAVVEVGMGGARDATNLCEPLVSIITQVALDHREELGDSVEQIAREKAGIARGGRPLLTGATGGALEVIEETCRRVGASLEVAGRDFAIVDAELGLCGPHQPANASLAVRAALKLSAVGLPVPDEAIRQGLRQAWIPGRMERIVGPDGQAFWIDGAHNPHGAAALAGSIEALGLGRPRWLVLAAYADKDVEGMLAALWPAIDGLVCTRTSAPRCLTAEALTTRARAVAPPYFDIRTASDLPEAVALLRRLPAEARIIGGSLSVVAEARRAILEGPR